MVDLNTLPNRIGGYTRTWPDSHAWKNGDLIAGVTNDYVNFGKLNPIGYSIKKVPVSNNEEVISVIKKGPYKQ